MTEISDAARLERIEATVKTWRVVALWATILAVASLGVHAWRMLPRNELRIVSEDGKQVLTLRPERLTMGSTDYGTPVVSIDGPALGGELTLRAPGSHLRVSAGKDAASISLSGGGGSSASWRVSEVESQMSLVRSGPTRLATLSNGDVLGPPRLLLMSEGDPPVSVVLWADPRDPYVAVGGRYIRGDAGAP